MSGPRSRPAFINILFSRSPGASYPLYAQTMCPTQIIIISNDDYPPTLVETFSYLKSYGVKKCLIWELIELHIDSILVTERDSCDTDCINTVLATHLYQTEEECAFKVMILVSAICSIQNLIGYISVWETRMWRTQLNLKLNALEDSLARNHQEIQKKITEK